MITALNIKYIERLRCYSKMNKFISNDNIAYVGFIKLHLKKVQRLRSWDRQL
ncbi:hypothetical protein VCRA2119O381_2650001 [Vibrio crassostreae]|nr:hypothetical protein VCRA2119O381_2650001 [Vibrio crassostreae]